MFIGEMSPAEIHPLGFKVRDENLEGAELRIPMRFKEGPTMWRREVALPCFPIAAHRIKSGMSSPLSTIPSPSSRQDRWTFLRDVLVFQGKLFLSNIRDIALMPASLVAALVDLVGEKRT